jgi:hypothetical protein
MPGNGKMSLLTEHLIQVMATRGMRNCNGLRKNTWSFTRSLKAYTMMYLVTTASL